MRNERLEKYDRVGKKSKSNWRLELSDDMNWKEKKAGSPLKSSEVEVEVPGYEKVKARSQNQEA